MGIINNTWVFADPQYILSTRILILIKNCQNLSNMAGAQLLYNLHFMLGYLLFLLSYTYKFTSMKSRYVKKIGNYYNIINTPLAYSRTFILSYLYYQLILLITFKFPYNLCDLTFLRTFVFFCVFLLFMRYLLGLFKFFSSNQAEAELVFAILGWLIVALSGFFYTRDFILFFLNLELLATIYYFFFLIFLNSSTITLIKFKNVLSNYLWVSFFTLVVFFTNLLLLVYWTGSLEFTQLTNNFFCIPSIVWQLLLIAFLWKIGSPGFYFFKFELYQYLPMGSLFMFSLTNVFLSCFLLYFFFSVSWAIYSTYSSLLLVYLLVTNIILVIRGSRALAFYQFLAISAVNTWALLLLLFLI